MALWRLVQITIVWNLDAAQLSVVQKIPSVVSWKLHQIYLQVSVNLDGLVLLLHKQSLLAWNRHHYPHHPPAGNHTGIKLYVKSSSASNNKTKQRLLQFLESGSHQWWPHTQENKLSHQGLIKWFLQGKWDVHPKSSIDIFRLLACGMSIPNHQ